MPRCSTKANCTSTRWRYPASRGQLACACPGSGPMWNADQALDPRPVEQDIETLKAWGATGLITLVERHELVMVNAPDLPELLKAQDVWWKHLPIRDMAPPGKTFAGLWDETAVDIHARLAAGERIAMHCLAGLGRTGTIAAKILVERGMKPKRPSRASATRAKARFKRGARLGT